MLTFLCSLFGCEPDPRQNKYERGDVMKFYGTDIKCTIVYCCSNGHEYRVRYMDKIGVVHDRIVGTRDMVLVEKNLEKINNE